MDLAFGNKTNCLTKHEWKDSMTSSAWLLYRIGEPIVGDAKLHKMGIAVCKESGPPGPFIVLNDPRFYFPFNFLFLYWVAPLFQA